MYVCMCHLVTESTPPQTGSLFCFAIFITKHITSVLRLVFILVMGFYLSLITFKRTVGASAGLHIYKITTAEKDNHQLCFVFVT